MLQRRAALQALLCERAQQADTRKPCHAGVLRSTFLGVVVAQNKLRLTLCVQGMWAEKELPRMAAPEIAEFEAVLDQENPDMFKWLTGQVRGRRSVLEEE